MNYRSIKIPLIVLNNRIGLREVSADVKTINSRDEGRAASKTGDRLLAMGYKGFALSDWGRGQ